jgi:hypothetical protein
MSKFGKIKRQHGRIEGLDKLLDRIVRDCPHVLRVVPGRMGRKQGRTPERLKVQYETPGGRGKPCGLKCIYTRAGSWQEVFLICGDTPGAHRWMQEQGIVET